MGIVQLMYCHNYNIIRVFTDEGSGKQFNTNIDTNSNVYEITYTASAAIFKKNDVVMTGSPVTTNLPTTNKGPMFYTEGGTSYRIDSDWVLVRKYASSEPTSSFGAEQNN